MVCYIGYLQAPIFDAIGSRGLQSCHASTSSAQIAFPDTQQQYPAAVAEPVIETSGGCDPTVAIAKRKRLLLDIPRSAAAVNRERRRMKRSGDQPSCSISNVLNGMLSLGLVGLAMPYYI